jgi:carboxypeptidase C (cathepsin A)
MPAVRPRTRSSSADSFRLLRGGAAALLALLLWVVPQGGEAQIPQFGTIGSIQIPLDSAVTTQHTVTIEGVRIPYTATAGTMPVLDSSGNPAATVFYVYYERSDVQDRSTRPLTFSFNGGPGSSSVWMHVGYTGPRLLRIDDEGFPVQPYGFVDNPHSILDVTDIVYVDPVNTGFARLLDGGNRSDFFGVSADIQYLADWIQRFVNRHDRWASPKFLKGESYGTTRVAGLSRRLMSAHYMYFSGVILVSPTGMGVARGEPVSTALNLPHYAATAWYHGQLEPVLQSGDLYDFLEEVETFTIDEYIPALVRGGFLDGAERRRIARTVARYAGVSDRFVLDHNLLVPIVPWRKELLRHEGLTVGRLDSRYRGVDRMDAGTSYDYDPALTAWNHAFAPAINMYLRNQLRWETELEYNVFGPVHPWDRSGDDTGEDLRRAMAENPYLKVHIQAGYYDGGTDYFSAKYTMWNMDRSGKLRDRFRFDAYRSGHMMYLRTEDLPTSNQHIREFMEWAIPAPGTPARY